MSSFDEDLRALAARLAAFTSTPVGRRRPGELEAIRAAIAALGGRAGEGDVGAEYSLVRVRRLDALERRTGRVEQVTKQLADSLRRMAEARRRRALSAPTPIPDSRGRSGFTLGLRPRGARALERIRAAAVVALVLAAVAGGASLSSRRGGGAAEGAEPYRGPGAGERRYLTSDEVAALVRAEASGSAEYAPPAPVVSHAALLRPLRPPPAAEEGPTASLEEITRRVELFRDSIARTRRELPAGEGGAEGGRQALLASRRESRVLLGELDLLAARAGPAGFALFLRIAEDPGDPILPELGTRLARLARSAAVDRWLAESLRSGALPPSRVAIQAAAERGGGDLRGALLEIARLAPAPESRRLALEGLARAARTSDAVALVALADDPVTGLDAARAAATLASLAAQEGDQALAAAVMNEVRARGAPTAALLLIAAGTGGREGREMLRKAALSGDPALGRAVLAAARALPTQLGFEAAALLAHGQDPALAKEAREVLQGAHGFTDE